LNKRYNHLKNFLKWAKPFPSFHDICNDLILEELMMGVEVTSGSATAFAASGEKQ
jgi:hypothetical protein